MAFWREDGPAMEYEVRFQAIDGPALAGARLLMTQAADSPEIALPELAATVTRPEKPAPVIPTPPDQAVLPSVPVAPPSPAELLVLNTETMRTLLCHEHPPYLKKALLSAKRRLVIVSPWIRDSVIDWPFIASLEALLRSGVDVYIGYGIEKADGNGKRNAAKDKPDISPRAEADLQKLAARYKNFNFVHVGKSSLSTKPIFLVGCLMTLSAAPLTRIFGPTGRRR